MGIGKGLSKYCGRNIIALKPGKRMTSSSRMKKNPAKITGATMEANENGGTKKNRRRNQKKSLSPTQKLYDTCKVVFSSSYTGFVPPPDNMEKLRAVLDDIKPIDVGVNQDMDCFRPNPDGNLAITYLHIFENEKFSMGIFCLPPSAVIPLHNHPGMTVFSKLLFGTMHIKAYDWVTDLGGSSYSIEDNDTQTKLRLAEVKIDSNFTAPCKSSILFPSGGGNMHCFTAVTACAVLDVLGPPYSDVDGRHCTYYHDFPLSAFKVDNIPASKGKNKSYAWLKETEKPDELSFLGKLYSGPKISF